MSKLVYGFKKIGLALGLSLLVWGCSSDVETDDVTSNAGKGESNLTGSEQTESNLTKNEQTDEYSTIIFNEDGAPEVKGDLIAGKKIKVIYDYNRLFKYNPGCACTDDEYKKYLPNGAHPEIRLQYKLTNDYLFTDEVTGISNIFASAPEFATIDSNNVQQPLSIWFFCVDHAATRKAQEAATARQSTGIVIGKSGQTTKAYPNTTITTDDCCKARDPNYQGGGCGSVVAGSGKSNFCMVYDSNNGKNYQFNFVTEDEAK